ncbi:MAG: hypothetical protein PHC34_06705 [Candidatus Gastranaerophilales bacterium]|nr:hypothetical protein [Candidatus Gastranaerophilales bacterium]
MLTINKTCAVLPAGNIQNNQKQDTPKLQTLSHDTVSFSGKRYISDAVLEAVRKAEKENGKKFFTKLRELCEWGYNGDLAGKADAYAQILKGEYVQKAISLLDLIEKDPETKNIMRQTAKYLKKSVGIDPH